MKEYELKVASNGAETVPYNEPEYPFYAGKGCLHAFKDMGVINHWHWDMEFAYVLTGSISYTINLETVTLHAGEGIFINSSQIHRNFSIDGTDGEYLCVLIHPSALQSPFHKAMQSLKDIGGRNSAPFMVLFPDIQWQKVLIDAINTIYEDILSGVERNILAILSHAYGIVHSLMSNIPHDKEDGGNAHDLNSMREMMGYMQMHYADRIIVSDISRAGKVGNSTCHSLFRKFLGTSPMKYLMDLRMEKAISLLETTDASIAEIAEKTGFASPSYFSECFREKYALSPSVYRNHAKITNDRNCF